MNCCSVITKTFADALMTTVPFSGTATPKVKVIYYDDVLDVWGYANPWTVITIEPGMVAVDHGGPATGIIQLIQ